MRSTIRSLVLTVCTVAAVAVVPLAVDLRAPEESVDPIVGVTEVAASTAGDVPSAHRANGVYGPAGSPVVDAEPAAAATLAAEREEASNVVAGFSEPTAAEPVADTVTVPVTPSVAVPSAVPVTPSVAVPVAAPVTPSVADTVTVPVTPSVAVPSAVPVTPTGAVVDLVGEPQIEEPSERTVTDMADAVSVGGSAPIEGGVGSGMGGDLPPELLPTPAYPQCPITESGLWWTDPADPYTCIPPDSIPFHEPTPPGIPPELLEPIFEAPETPETPEGSVGWYEPTPPGIDPALLEPIMEDVGEAESGE